MSDSDKIFAARYVAQSISTGDIVRFAEDRLNEGIFSDHYLAIVDEEIKVWETVSPHLVAVFEENKIRIPTFNEAIWVLIEYHVRIITDGCLSPRKQFGLLLKDIDRFDLQKDITEYVGDNVGISRMYGWYYDDYSGIGKVDNEIYNECQNWLMEYVDNH
jgi:hypothetical protein